MQPEQREVQEPQEAQEPLAHEARARALRALGREDEGLAAWAAAKAVAIADPEDQEIVDGDFADAP